MNTVASAVPADGPDPFVAGDSLGHRLVAGDDAALAECYAEYGGAVRRYVARYVETHEVDDVTQRVFWEVWRARARFDPSRSLQAWLFAIARKRAIDQVRKRAPVTAPLDLVGDRVGVDGRDTASRHAWATTVRDALAQLTEVQRAVLQLAYFDGYTQREIAGLLEVPLGTVKTRSSRGLARLGELLNPGLTA